MRILIATTDYASFLSWFYASNPGLQAKSFDEQAELRSQALFSVADSYSFNLRRLGHEANVVYSNNEYMQKAWAAEHGIGLTDQRKRSLSSIVRSRLPNRPKRVASRIVHRARRVLRKSNPTPEVLQVLAAQVHSWKPDVVIDQSIGATGSSFWTEARADVRLVIGQHASALPAHADFSAYDLMVSSLPNLVEYFQTMGVSAEILRLGFDPRVLDVVRPAHRDIAVSFVGSLHPVHLNRLQVLEAACRHERVAIWGDGFDALPPTSPVRRCWRGQAWGREMFDVLGRSRITLNVHASVAGGHANNMRLYEATGMGSLLLTDERIDLNEFFDPGTEVITYRDPDECGAQLRRYLATPDEAARIARAGQARTWRDHTYERRMQELDEIISRYVRSTRH